jgi:capsular exopolysaccharide synthesis family protein
VLKKKLSGFKQAKRLRTLLITSVSSSEGKTLTAINLALTIAQEIDQRVLLVDSNLKRPSVHSVLGLSAEKGLVDVLRGESLIADVMLKTRISNFAVVPSGSKSEESRELLNGEKMQEVLAASAELFDWVILNSPPLVPFEDVEGLSSLVDGILVVVGARQTRQSVVSRIQPLKGKKLLGFVLNGIHSQAELDVNL